MAVTTIKSTYSLEVESLRAGGVSTSLDGVEVRSVAAGACLCNELPALTTYLGWSSPIEVREVATIVPGLVRAGRPRSQVVFVRAGRPRSRGVFLHEP